MARSNPVARKTKTKTTGKSTFVQSDGGGNKVRIGKDGGGTYGPKSCSGNRAHFYQSH